MKTAIVGKEEAVKEYLNNSQYIYIQDYWQAKQKKFADVINVSPEDGYSRRLEIACRNIISRTQR